MKVTELLETSMSRNDEIAHLKIQASAADHRFKIIQSKMEFLEKNKKESTPEKLLKLDYQFRQAKIDRAESIQHLKDYAVKGNTYLFTGFRSDEMSARIVQLGGWVVDNFSNRVNYVIAKDPGKDSGKLQKARQNGVRILSRDQLTHILRP